jgi:type IV pilus assembly protein PilN
VSGIAQTQERISELLRNTAYSSEWLVRPELVESKAAAVQGANKEQRQLFEFAMRLGVKRPQEAASAPAGAASAPAVPAVPAVPAATASTPAAAPKKA